MTYKLSNFMENLKEEGLGYALKEDAKKTKERKTLGPLIGLGALVLGVGLSTYVKNPEIYLPCRADLICERIEEFKIDADKKGNSGRVYTDVYDSEGKHLIAYVDWNGDGNIDVAFTPWGAFWSEEKLKSKQYVDLGEDYKHSPNNPSWCDKYPGDHSCP